MRLIYVFLFLLFLTSCHSSPSDKIENELAEFNFRENNPLKPNTYFESFALGFVEEDTVQNGETYRLKLFLVNHDKLYSSDSISPRIKFHYRDSISWGKLLDSDKHAKVVEDTAYIKFTAKDEGLKNAEVKKLQWYGSIAIPRSGKADTVFVIEYDYYLQQK
jgi:hypothetical protein